MVLNLITAMKLLHGDQKAPKHELRWYTVATINSHEIGNPRTTLAKGRVYCSYSSRTTDVWGDRSAE